MFAYEWCSAIYGNREHLEHWESLLLVCLEVGFRHLDPWRLPTDIRLTHTEHHRGLVDMVFKSQNSEAIADLLHARTMGYFLPDRAGEMVDFCTRHLDGLHNLVQFSPRLRRLVIRFVEVVGYKGFEGAGVEGLIELLDHLHVTAEEMDWNSRWTSLLLNVIRSSEGTRRLSHWYWELLVELAVSEVWWLKSEDTDTLKIAKSLIGAREWGKLECWIGIMWMFPKLVAIRGKNLEHSTLLLFRHRPGAAQKLEQWMEQWSKQKAWRRVPESLQRILTRAQEAAPRQDTL